MRGFSKDCRMPQFLHLHHQGRGHSPCHHQLQWSSEWTRQRTTIIVMIYLLFIFNIIVLDIWNLRKIEFLSTSYCIYLLLFWCMGQGWKFPKSQLYNNFKGKFITYKTYLIPISFRYRSTVIAWFLFLEITCCSKRHDSTLFLLFLSERTLPAVKYIFFFCS